MALPVNPSSRDAEHGEFIPIGVIGQAEEAEPTLIAGPSSTVVGGRVRGRRRCRARAWMSGLA